MATPTAPRSGRNPLIAVTLGDPAGVGPEVVAKALARPRVRALADLVVIGNTAVLDRAFALVDSELHAARVADPAESVAPDAVGVHEEEPADALADLPYGRISAAAGTAAVAWATTAGRLALEGRVDGVATAPLNKEAAHLAGGAEVGHQEIYQALTGAELVMTMLLAPGLRVVHLTTHRSLREACDAVTRDAVLAALRLTHDFFAEHGIPRPRIAAAALNPHGGEAGLLGWRSPRPSLRPWRPHVSSASTPPGRSPPMRSSTAPSTAHSTSCSRCTTTRATSPSRCTTGPGASR